MKVYCPPKKLPGSSAGRAAKIEPRKKGGAVIYKYYNIVVVVVS
jgi:hypothetical protein